MIVNVLDHVGAEYHYFNDMFNIVRKEFDDTYNVVVGILHNEKREETIKFFKSDKKNILLLVSEESECPFFSEYLRKFDLIFRTYNHNNKFDNERIFPVPAGYVTRIPFSWNKRTIKKFETKPLKERENDIFYSGQSSEERVKCVNEAKKLNVKSDLEITGGFMQGNLDNYIDRMNNSKIALVPKGLWCKETFRYFEAYHSNCVVITTLELNTKHSNIWYYQNSPAIVLKDWSQLSQGLVDSILRDLDKYELKNREYYSRCISVEGVAKYVTEVMKNKL